MGAGLVGLSRGRALRIFERIPGPDIDCRALRGGWASGARHCRRAVSGITHFEAEKPHVRSRSSLEASGVGHPQHGAGQGGQTRVGRTLTHTK